MDIQIYGTRYLRPGEFGDFYWMSEQPEYEKSLFIFNDNEEHHYSCHRGLGNAIMRQFNKYNKNFEIPKSAGIPTGTLRNGGYDEFTEENKKKIDIAIHEIKELLEKYKYDKIFYSIDKKGNLGTALFEVDDEVKKYIQNNIHKLSIHKVIKFNESNISFPL